MKILVTGATGNVGKYVVSELLKKGEKVVAGDVDLGKIQAMFENQVASVTLDFTDSRTFSNALRGVDRVFLMRPPHLGKPEDLYPFIDALKTQGVKLVAFLSLMGVENNPIPPHHKIEKYIEKCGLPFAHIRPGFFMQNLSGVHAMEIKNNNEIFIPAGSSKTSFIDAADIGIATATLLNQPERYKNTSHTVTGPEALTYFDVAEILSEVTGKNIRYSKPSYMKYRNYYIKTRNLDKTYVNVTVALYFMTRMGTAQKTTTTFYELTGRQPRTFRDFASEHVSAFV